MIDQAHYDLCISKGTSPRLAEMLASGTPPPIRTATALAAQHGTIADQFKDNPLQAKRLAKKYRKKFGMELPYNGVYCSNIARESLDPAAVVPSFEISSSVKRAATERGCGAQDADENWIVKPRELEAPPVRKDIRLAKHLVEEEYRKRTAADPSLEKLSKQEKLAIREEIITTHGSKKATGGTYGVC